MLSEQRSPCYEEARSVRCDQRRTGADLRAIRGKLDIPLEKVRLRVQDEIAIERDHDDSGAVRCDSIIGLSKDKVGDHTSVKDLPGPVDACGGNARVPIRNHNISIPRKNHLATSSQRKANCDSAGPARFLRIRFANMSRLLIVLIVTMYVTTSAFALDVALGPETPLSPPSVTPAPYEQHLSGVASNGRDFLAIWLDRRSTVAPMPYVYSVPLYVSRVDRTGRSTNPFGLKLLEAAVSAALVSTSVGYMVLWSENGETDSMLLDDDGAPISASKRLTDGYLIGAASNGRTIFVIHGPFSNPQFASVFSADGTLLSRTSLDPANHYPQSMRPIIMPNGDYGLIDQAWHCPGTVACDVTATLTTISESGSVTTKPLGPLSQWSQSAVAIGNGRLLLAWMNDNLTTNPARNVAFRMFDTAGNPLSAETTIDETNDIRFTSGDFAPSVGWDGHEFLVAWQWQFADEQSGEIRALRVTADGMVIDSAPMILSPTLGTPPWFASTGTSQLVAWDTLISTRSDVDVRSVSSFDSLSYAATQIIPESAALQTQVNLAPFGSNTLAVWREGDTNPSIVASFVGGTPAIVSPAGALDQQAPAAGASSNQCLIVWREQVFASQPQQSFRILGKRVASDGTPIDRNPIVIAEYATPGVAILPAANSLAVASDGTDFFVVWPVPDDRLSGVRVSSAGVVLDQIPIDVSRPPNGTAGSPHIVWNGSEYVVVWTADPSCKTCLFSPLLPFSQIFVAHVTADGKLADSKMIWQGGYGPRVAVARGSNGWMLAWDSPDAVSNQDCVYTMPLREDGAPAGSSHAVTCTALWGWPPQFPDLDAAWDGVSFVVAWTELTSSATVARAIRVSVDGNPLDAAPFNVSLNASASFQPALASSSSGVVVAYARIAMEPQYGGVGRLFARSLPQLNLPSRRRAAR
jgi:hypothetical protein